MSKRFALLCLTLALLFTAGCAAKGPIQPDFTHGSVGAKRLRQCKPRITYKKVRICSYSGSTINVGAARPGG